MEEYEVRWSIDIHAEDAQDAARQALEIQRRRDTTATVFTVHARDRARTLVDVVDLTPDTA
jgi:hypothetical protein